MDFYKNNHKIITRHKNELFINIIKYSVLNYPQSFHKVCFIQCFNLGQKNVHIFQLVVMSLKSFFLIEFIEATFIG